MYPSIYMFICLSIVFCVCFGSCVVIPHVAWLYIGLGYEETHPWVSMGFLLPWVWLKTGNEFTTTNGNGCGKIMSATGKTECVRGKCGNMMITINCGGPS